MFDQPLQRNTVLLSHGIDPLKWSASLLPSEYALETVSSLTKSEGWPLHPLSCTSVLPPLKNCIHLYALALFIASQPYITHKCSWSLFPFTPSTFKNLITARFSHLDAAPTFESIVMTCVQLQNMCNSHEISHTNSFKPQEHAHHAASHQWCQLPKTKNRYSYFWNVPRITNFVVLFFVDLCCWICVRKLCFIVRNEMKNAEKNVE